MPTVLPLVSARIIFDGRMIELKWGGIADPGGWSSFARDTTKYLLGGATVGTLSVNNIPTGSGRVPNDTNAGVGSASNANLVAWRIESGLFYVIAVIEVATLNKRFWMGESVIASMDQGFIADDTGQIVTAGFTNTVVNTKEIGIVPLTNLLTGVNGNCICWLESGFQEISGTVGGPLSLATDRSGRSQNAVGSGNSRPTFSAGTGSTKRSGSQRADIVFDGVDDKLYIAHNAIWNTTSNFSLSVVIKPSDLSDRYIISKRLLATDKCWWLRIKNGVVVIGVSSNGVLESEYEIYTPVINRRDVVSIVKNGAVIEACVNGRVISVTSSAPATINTSTAKISIGSPSYDEASTELYKGDLTEIIFHVVALSEDQWASLIDAVSDRWQIDLAGIEPIPSALPSNVVEKIHWVEINLLATGASVTDYLSQQANDWYDDGVVTKETLKAAFQAKLDAIWAIRSDFNIQIRLFGGKLRDDIMSSDPFPYVTQKQMDALVEVIEDPSNNFGSGVGQRRLSLYTGINYCYDSINDIVTHNGVLGNRVGGRMNNRALAALKSSALLSNVFQRYLDFSSLLNTFFCDAGTVQPGLTIKHTHSSEIINAGVKIISEAYSDDIGHKEAIPFACLATFGSAPWWINNDYTQGYNADWLLDGNSTRVFVIINSGNEIDCTHGVVPTLGIANSSLSLADMIIWMQKGVNFIVKIGKEQDLSDAIDAVSGGGSPVSGAWFNRNILRRNR